MGRPRPASGAGRRGECDYFFAEGVAHLKDIPPMFTRSFSNSARGRLRFRLKSQSKPFCNLPALANRISDPFQLAAVIEVASEIARRSAASTAPSFLNRHAEVLERLRRIKDPAVTRQAIELAAEFASRAGGVAARRSGSAPAALTSLNSPDALKLLNSTVGFLERGGGSALQVLITGGDILRPCRKSSTSG